MPEWICKASFFVRIMMYACNVKKADELLTRRKKNRSDLTGG